MSSPATMSRDDALAILGFSAGSTPTVAELKKAYRKKALETHPDKPGGSAEAFRTLTEAYELLMKEHELKTKPSETTSPQKYTSFDDLVADIIKNFGAENVTVTHTPAGASNTKKPKYPTVCTHFLQGDCRYGDNCWNLHPYDTRPVCKHFLRGDCKFGNKCRNRHATA